MSEGRNVPRRTIGWLARESGVSVETVRFYEREGLLPRAPRAESSNYRIFDEAAVGRMRFIRRAQELGFTLHETRELLGLESAAEVPCDEVRAQAEGKLRDIRAKIEDLQKIESVLSQLVRACRSTGEVGPCPIIGALMREDS